MRQFRGLSTVVLTCLLAPVGWAQCETRLRASDGQPGDFFGRPVAVDGNVAIIGAPGDDDLGNSSGAAYVFRFDGTQWVEEQKLHSSEPVDLDRFGKSASVSGNVALVGAGHNNEIGSAYIFRHDGTRWIEEQKLTASDGNPGDLFATELALRGNVALISSSQDDDHGTDSGSAYVFRYDGTTWIEEQKLTASDAGLRHWFGRCLSLSDHVALIGAPRHDAAYVFRFDGTTWIEEQKLTASDGGQVYGESVSIDGDVAFVGDTLDDDAGENFGAAYVYRYDGSSWREVQKLTPGDLTGQFGHSIALRGELAFVCSHSNGAYVFRYDGSRWIQVRKLTPSDPSVESGFGDSVSVCQDFAMVEASLDDEGGENTGTAYVYQTSCLLDYSRSACEVKIPATPFIQTDGFGYSLSVENGLLVVGAPFMNAGGYTFIYRFDGTEWRAGQALRPNDPQGWDAFGNAISLNGNAVLIGASRTNVDGQEHAGAAYVFRLTELGWVQETMLSASEPDRHEQFGSSVSLSGDVALISAPRDDENGEGAGAAYVFRFDGTHWNEEAKLLSDLAGINDNFGASVALEGDIAVVGASGDSYWQGAIFVFRDIGGSWIREAKITASDGTREEWFGQSVSLDAGVIVVGKDGDNRPGSAYVYRHDGISWVEEAKLTAEHASSNDYYGSRVTVDGELASVSAWDQEGHGVAYLYRHSNAAWKEVDQLRPSDGRDNDAFGLGLSLDGSTVIVGSPRNDEAGINAGAVYFYRAASAMAFGTGWPGTLGVPELTLAGKPVAGDTVTFQLENSLGEPTTALILIGTQEASLQTGLGGTLWLVPAWTAAQALSPSGLETQLEVPTFLVGVSLFLQALEIDSGASHGVSFTRGLRIDLCGH